MAVGLNKIMVIGNLGTDPEMRYTPSGKPVTSFRLAINRVYRTDDGERQEETSELAESTEEVSLDAKLRAAGIAGGGASGGDVLARLKAKRNG